jgi:hypothetical protein
VLKDRERYFLRESLVPLRLKILGLAGLVTSTAAEGVACCRLTRIAIFSIATASPAIVHLP